MRRAHRTSLALVLATTAALDGCAAAQTEREPPRQRSLTPTACRDAYDAATAEMARAEGPDGAGADGYRRAGNAYLALWQGFASRVGRVNGRGRCASDSSLRLDAARAFTSAGDTVRAIEILRTLEKDEPGRSGEETASLVLYQLAENYAALGWFHGAAYYYSAYFLQSSDPTDGRVANALTHAVRFAVGTGDTEGVAALESHVALLASRNPPVALPLFIEIADYFLRENAPDRALRVLTERRLDAIDRLHEPLVAAYAHATSGACAGEGSAEHAALEYGAVLDSWTEGKGRAASDLARLESASHAVASRVVDALPRAAAYLEARETEVERRVAPHARVIALGDAVPLPVRLGELARVGGLYEEAAGPAETPSHATRRTAKPTRGGGAARKNARLDPSLRLRESARASFLECVRAADESGAERADRAACDAGLARHEKVAAPMLDELAPAPDRLPSTLSSHGSADFR